MITQQINLYQPIFRKERKLLSFRVLLQAVGAVLLLLGVLYGMGVNQTMQIKSDLALLQSQSNQQADLLTSIGAKLAAKKPDTTYQAELATLEEELVASQKVVAALKRVKDSYTKGISNYLVGFSRQAPRGVWLTGFTVQAGGESLVIRGSSLEPGLVPVFLERLSNEAVLKGTEFGLLQIQRENADSRYVDFVVYTGTEPPEAMVIE